MALVMAIFGIGALGVSLWYFASDPQKREVMLKSFADDPIKMSFHLIWLIFFIMFFGGIFIQPFGMIKLTENGWQVWEIGGWGFFGMWLIGTILIKGF
jgi:hypothetical protein